VTQLEPLLSTSVFGEMVIQMPSPSLLPLAIKIALPITISDATSVAVHTLLMIYSP